MLGVLRVGHAAGGHSMSLIAPDGSHLAEGQYFGCLDWSFEESSAISQPQLKRELLLCT